MLGIPGAARKHGVGHVGYEERLPGADDPRRARITRPVLRKIGGQRLCECHLGEIAVYHRHTLDHRRPRRAIRVANDIYGAPVAKPRHGRLREMSERCLVVGGRCEQPTRLRKERGRRLGVTLLREVREEHHEAATTRGIRAQLDGNAQRR